MTEIELKARVKDPDAVEQKLNQFAEFEKEVLKEDYYYKNRKYSPSPSIRIRLETVNGSTTNILTYKKKENRISEDGSQCEVNQELETTIENHKVLEQWLLDSGAELTTRKTKHVKSWKAATEFGSTQATLELCNIERLGWFLEIEILSEKSDSETVGKIHAELEMLLEKSGLEKTDIETKYYSELLKELEK